MLLAAIALLLLVPRWTGVDAGLAPDSRWDARSVFGTPIWLQVWLLGVLSPTFLASLLFLRRSLEARFAAAGFALGHVPLALGLELTVGTVGLIHLVCWTPALLLLARRRPQVDPRTPFGLWVHAMLAVIAIGLAFDLRDAIRFLLLY